MEAPVVVNPDIASKKASETLSGLSVISMNGSMPNVEKNTHTMAVSRKPSRLPIDGDVGCMAKAMTEPVASVTAKVIKKAFQSLSPYIRHVVSGTKQKGGLYNRSSPMMRSSTGILMTGK